MTNVIMKGETIITLYDGHNDKEIVKLDVTNVEGSIMDYYYYYFGGYDKYISYLIRRGAVEIDSNDKQYLQCEHKVVVIYEIPKSLAVNY